MLTKIATTIKVHLQTSSVVSKLDFEVVRKRKS